MSKFIKDSKEYICLNDYIAVKLWSKEDVRDRVLERYPEYNDNQIKKIVSDVISSGYLKALEDCTDDDWSYIDYAIDEVQKKDENQRSRW